MLVNINTMSQKRLRPKNIPIVKSVYNSFAVLLQALMKVIDSLCNMNMIANTIWLQFVTQFHGLIGNSERCMHTHHSGDHITVVCKCMLDKIHVLHYRFSGFLHSVTVRNLIAQTGTDTKILSC